MDMKIANRFFELRKAHGYSQDELADALEVSRQAVSKWERGESSPDTDNLIALARLYDVSLDALLDYNPKATHEFENATTADSEEIPKESAEGNVKFKAEKAGNSVVVDGNKILITSAMGGKVEISDEKIVKKVKDGICNGEFTCGEEKPDHAVKPNWNTWRDVPIFAVTVLAYLLVGFIANIWHPTWLIFFLIPIYYCVIECIKNKDINAFPVPIIVTGVFLMAGFLWNWWHPGWALFLIIPLYYILVAPFAKKIKGE